jgi:hypothetical protein
MMGIIWLFGPRKASEFGLLVGLMAVNGLRVLEDS